LMASAEQHVATLHTREVALNTLEFELDKRSQRQQMNEELLRVRRESLTKEIQDGVHRELNDKEEQLQRRLKELDKLHNRIDQQQVELDALEGLRDQVGDDPQGLLDELDALRQDKRVLDREVQALRANRSEDDANELRTQRDRLQELLTKNESELFSLRHRESEWRSSVTEQQDWQKTRKVLEKNRELLHDVIDRLQNDVDSMLSKHKENTVFPELTRMDLELIKPVHTDPAPELKHLVAELQARILYAEPKKMLHFRKEELQLFIGGLAMSQLHIFQGISGTGKTSLATAFAKAVGGECTIVPVQAGWRDRADLLGHFNAFEKRYYERNTLQALYRAQSEAHKDRLHIVLLDEMNLSRPEQYFAEFLSAMELSESDRWINLMESRPAHGAPEKLRNGRDILLPSNLWFIGTANHDETTNAFADKTHDRAFVLELPKQDIVQEVIAKPQSRASWSFESLNRQFSNARDKYKDQTAELQTLINQSSLTKLLSETFKLGWGNRLESQMKRFVPVVLEAGGSEALAVDHLLASRMFRDGKVIGRHDVSAIKMHQVEDALRVMWDECELSGEPTRCLAALNSDIERLESGR
jgi:MoxR-like ATPase